jgi:crossover junction endodeoxyribonuclease RusA
MKSVKSLDPSLRLLTFFIVGTPAPQGSKRHVGRGIMVESSKKVKPWREAVKWAVPSPFPPFAGPLDVELVFSLKRPKGHYGTGRNAGKLKESSPAYPATRPDIDKLARSTLDGLGEAGVFGDDSQIVTLLAEKRYTDEATGCRVTIKEAE